MLKIREEKLEAMKDVLGEARISQLDLMIQKFRDAADAADLLSKEEEVAVEEAEAVGEDVETEVNEVEEDVENVDEVEAEEDVEDEAEEEVEEVEPVEDDAEAEDGEGDNAVEFATSDQLIQVVDFLKEAFEEVAGAVADIRKDVADVKAVAAVNQQEVLDKAQEDVLMTSLASMLGAAQSVVGAQEAIVKEEDGIADAAPKEAEVAPVSFIDNAIFNILEGK